MGLGLRLWFALAAGLVPLARWDRGIVRRLGRLPQFRLQRLDPLRQHVDLFRQRLNLRDQLIFRELSQGVRIHRILESRIPPSVNYILCPADTCSPHLRPPRVSNYKYFVTETFFPHCGVDDENYGMFPARFGNIYTARQLVKLFD